LSTYYDLVRRADANVTLHVHTHVREDALQLYGFATAAERSIFERLLAISGVGPRIALAVLSGIGPEELERAVREGDRDRLERIPGIGRKTAERILLELRDRLGRDGRASSRRSAPTAAADEHGEGPGRLRRDAVSALHNLGYGPEAAGGAVDAALEALGPAAPLQDILRSALRGLMLAR
jgi:Holliday junction DNA helicase RuvA